MSATDVATQVTPNASTLPAFTGQTIGMWHPVRAAMELDALILRPLRAGTPSMRAMGRLLLPPDDREVKQPAEYRKRLNRTFLFPGYDDGVKNVAARPFQKAVQVQGLDTADPNLRALETDCDRQGTSLTQFASRCMDTIADRGICHVLVDMPPATTDDGRIMNLKETKAAQVRPYFSLVHPDNLTTWSWQSAVGVPQLAFIVVYESLQEVNAAKGEAILVERLRVYGTSEWQVWQRTSPLHLTADANSLLSLTGEEPTIQVVAGRNSKASQGSGDSPYAMIGSGTHAFGAVPLVTVNISPQDDPLHAAPPMRALAWKNVEHWQSGSEHRNLVHWFGAPIVKGAGMPAEYVDGTKVMTLGAGAQVFSRDPAFDLGFAEPTGAGLEGVERDLDRIQRQMEALGMAPLLVNKGPQTATGEAIDEVRSQAEAQSWVEKLEWGLARCYEFAAKWLDTKLPEDFQVSVFRDFGLVMRSATDITALQQDAQAGRITTERYLHEAKRRGLYGDDLVPEDETTAAAEEADARAQRTMEKMQASGFGQPDDPDEKPEGDEE